MGTPPDRDGEGERDWQPGSWQQPAPEAPAWQQPPVQHGGWQRAPDGSWVQVGGSQSSGKSTAALVLGILGLVVCPLICSVLALLFGYQARNEIEASGGRLGGRGNATAGIVLGWIGIAIVAAFLVLFGIGLTVGAGEDVSTPGDLPHS